MTQFTPAFLESVIPTVVESDARTERSFDIFSLLLKERIVFLGTPIDDTVASLIIAQLLFLEAENSDKLIGPDVSTIAVGQTASMATVLLSAGAAGKRYALPNATVHMHQALGGARGQARDIEIAAKEILRNNEIIRNIIASHTGQTKEKVTEDFDRDFYLDAEGAKEYGFVDEILSEAENTEEGKKE